MTRLVDALRVLGVKGDIALSGRWVTIEGERCRVQVVEASWGAGYYSWCDDLTGRAVEHFCDPTEAILTGLRRACRQNQEAEQTTDG